jgi:diadenosine tetraphosphate (Ap4A) HIT family hydrolase
LSNEAWKLDRVGSAIRGENPTVMKKVPAGFAVMGDVQWLPGYCVLLTDNPQAGKLSDLKRSERSKFLESMAILGEAVETVCADRDRDFLRVNLEILGNADPFLHCHIWPRYAWEPPQLVDRPVWLYPSEYWNDPTKVLSPRHNALRAAITSHL